jgi:hypothetical protein
MQHLEVSGAVRLIYVIRRLKVNIISFTDSANVKRNIISISKTNNVKVSEFPTYAN